MRMLTFVVLIAVLAQAGLTQETQLGSQKKPPACQGYRLQTQQEALTAHQKFCYFLLNKAVTPSGVFGAAFTAGYAQLTNDPKEWGGGAQAYGERFGTRFTQGLTKSSTESLVGIFDHEDPRPHPSSERGTMLSNPSRILPRAGNALLRTVWTPRDSYADGSARSSSLAYSRIAGAFASGFVGMAWTPDRINTVGQAFGRTGTGFAGYAASSVWTEFQPDILALAGRLIGRHKSRPN